MQLSGGKTELIARVLDNPGYAVARDYYNSTNWESAVYRARPDGLWEYVTNLGFPPVTQHFPTVHNVEPD